MKKLLSILMVSTLSFSLLTGCTPKEESMPNKTSEQASTKPQEAKTPDKAAASVNLSVVSPYGGDDGNRANFEAAVKEYETATGNTVSNNSQSANEAWKAQVLSDFQTGAEPDVLFYFSGVDSNEIVNANMVVDVDTIKAKYPEYANNMEPSRMPTSPSNNKLYAIPVNGYWEALFVNKKVLEASGVKIPDANYTWDQFTKDCKTILDKGFTPIAASLTEVPHYWFEYSVLNHDTSADHGKLPANATDAIGKNWVSGLNDIKALYKMNAFPKNTLTAKDEETFQVMFDGKAAFALDGSWKIGAFEQNVPTKLADYTVVYPPAQGNRKATDLIGGMSMGYYITKKAWDDPAKQAAAVKFVEMMTTDKVVSTFGYVSATALKNGTTVPETASSLSKDAVAMVKAATSFTAAAQDNLSNPQKTALFGTVQNIVTDRETAEKAINDGLAGK